jgi:hypothetical protein
MQCSLVNSLCTSGCAPWGTIGIFSYGISSVIIINFKVIKCSNRFNDSSFRTQTNDFFGSKVIFNGLI